MGKEWAWSFSKLKNFRMCPKRMHEVDILKNYTESSEQLDWGNSVHKSLAAAVLQAKGIGAMGSGRDMVRAAPLPETMAYMQKWIDVIAASPGKVLVEQKFAITRDFQKTEYFAPNTWYRGICDLLMINGASATAIDWKTGKVDHSSEQLMLMATCIFIHHPTIQTVKTRFIWLKEDTSTPEVFTRAEVMAQWSELLGEVKNMEHAFTTLTFPPRPNFTCRKYCPVTSCPFHGKDNR